MHQDENLRGYYTKYDAVCSVLLYLVAESLSLTSLTSSGDLAPLGSISKNDAKLFQKFVHMNLRESMSRSNLA